MASFVGSDYDTWRLALSTDVGGLFFAYQTGVSVQICRVSRSGDTCVAVEALDRGHVNASGRACDGFIAPDESYLTIELILVPSPRSSLSASACVIPPGQRSQIATWAGGVFRQ